MRKIILGISVFSLLLLAVVAYSSNVFAQEGHENFNLHRDEHGDNNFNPNKELSKSACGSKLGEPLVNVTEKVRNDVDSGFGSTVWWAFDYYNRHIQVWQTGSNENSNTYCAIVTYDGQFYAVPGQVGPGNNPSGALIDSPVVGDMSGGYRATFNGTFAPITGTGAWPTHGNVGTVDYKCNITGSNSCTFVDWVAKYFPGYDQNSFAQPWWGWIYRAGDHGTWVNAINVTQPNSGNIL